MISFDGINREITLDQSQSIVSVQYIYSRWLDWVKLGNNATFPIAFRQSGGDPIGGGLFTGVYFFLQNVDGWRIKPPEADVVISIVGNLYPEDPALGFLNSTTGQFSTSVRLETSSNTQVAPLDELANSVAAKFLFDSGGRVLGDITGSPSAKEINRAVSNSIPSFPAPSTIWDAAPRHLKKAIKQKDYSDAIRSLSNKLDNLYSAIKSAQRDDMPGVDLDPILEAIGASRAPESAEILDRIAGLSIPDNTQDIASIRAQVETLQTEIESITDSIIEVRDEITRIPPPDLSAIATKSELSAVRSLVGKLSNYDDVQVKQMLEAIITNTEALPDDIERISRKTDIVLDNQLKLF